MSRQCWINAGDEISIVRQCDLAGLSRATVYAHWRSSPEDTTDLLLCGLLDEIYARRPFYGSRRMVVELRTQGHEVNRKCVQRLMRGMGLAAIMDWYSRKVLSWRLSNTMEVSFCVDCLEGALQLYGPPEVFNSDQGSQFTAELFTGVLKHAGVTISMDGRGRAFDNIFVERLWRTVKYEDIYLKGYADLSEVTLGLTEYFAFYNGERPHTALTNATPAMVYQTRQGGGALIVDKYGPAATPPGAPAASGQRCSAASKAQAVA